MQLLVILLLCIGITGITHIILPLRRRRKIKGRGGFHPVEYALVCLFECRRDLLIAGGFVCPSAFSSVGRRFGLYGRRRKFNGVLHYFLIPVCYLIIFLQGIDDLGVEKET